MEDLFDTIPEDPLDYDQDFILDPTKPLVLLLGWVDHEGILSSLKATGRQYKKKLLASSPENWKTIAVLFDEFTISSVLGKFPGRVLYLLAQSNYAEARETLFARVGKVPNQVYIYQDFLESSGIENVHNAVDSLFALPPEPRSDAIEFLRSNNIEILPYKTKAEVTVLAESFLGDLDRNLILRLYIPAGRLWSAEADRILQLFQEHMAKVNQLAVRLDQRRTDYGVIYEFHGETPPGESSLSSEFREFSELMDLCITDSKAAESVLVSKNLNETQISRIVERYSKEARRLQLDIKHEAERKMLTIHHRMESELIEFNLSPEESRAIDSLLNETVPNYSSSLPRISQALTNATFSAQSPAASITYNFRPQFVNTLNGIVAEEIRGDQHLSTEHLSLLEAVRQHGGAQARELETAVYEVADKGVEQADKLRAKKRLMSFLIAVGKKTGDMAFSVLQKYLEGQVGI